MKDKSQRYPKVLLTFLAIVWLIVNSLIAVSVYALFNDLLLMNTVIAFSMLIIFYVEYHFYQFCMIPYKDNVFHSQITKQNKLLPNSLSDAENIEKPSQIHNIFESVFHNWPFPVALFDDEHQLSFFNHAMYQLLNYPLCRGASIEDCGFQKQGSSWSHPQLQGDWKVDFFNFNEQHMLLVTASFIGTQLQTIKRKSQRDLIRILSHELNNSVTPIASLADSLLTSTSIDQKESEQILQRIKSRSEHLLSFIQRYAQLSRLPTPEPVIFDIKRLTELNAQEQSITLIFKGSKIAYGDPILFEQLIINIFKNSRESNNNKCEVEFINDQQSTSQLFTITDNGGGFANLNNVLTPLYTTKKSGQGLGLMLCEDIIKQHHGTMTLTNERGGACITISCPKM